MLKELFKKYEAAEIKANEADEMWAGDLENEELEKAFDKAYNEEWAAFNALVDEIVKTTNDMIDTKTAGFMIRAKRNELKRLITKMA